MGICHFINEIPFRYLRAVWRKLRLLRLFNVKLQFQRKCRKKNLIILRKKRKKPDLGRKLLIKRNKCHIFLESIAVTLNATPSISTVDGTFNVNFFVYIWRLVYGCSLHKEIFSGNRDNQRPEIVCKTVTLHFAFVPLKAFLPNFGVLSVLNFTVFNFFNL